MKTYNTIHGEMKVSARIAVEYYSREYIRPIYSNDRLYNVILMLYKSVEYYPLNEFEARSLATMINCLPVDPTPRAKSLFERSTGYTFPHNKDDIINPLKPMPWLSGEYL